MPPAACPWSLARTVGVAGLDATIARPERIFGIALDAATAMATLVPPLERAVMTAVAAAPLGAVFGRAKR